MARGWRDTAARLRRGRLDGVFPPLLWLNALLAYAFLYLPIGVLVLFSFSPSRYASVWGGFSLEWYVRVCHNPDIIQALLNSLLVATVTTLLATTLGTLAALGLERFSERQRAAHYDAALTLRILVPDIVQGISLLLLFVLIFNASERLLGW